MEKVPNKKLGQHWLNDPVSLDAMVEAAEVMSGEVVLEVGPGPGALTKKLLNKGATVIAVELDSMLASGLLARFDKEASAGSLKVTNDSILDFNLSNLPVNYKVCANIPYYLTSNLLRKLSESANPPSQIALLVQKEVAERITSNPGKMSILSVSVQLYCDVSLGSIVRAELFTPPPKVDSQIVILKHLGHPRFEVDTKLFFLVVKAGFSERRKKIRGSLAGGLQMPKSEADKILTSAGVNPDSRAQELSLEDWRRLTEEVGRITKNSDPKKS